MQTDNLSRNRHGRDQAQSYSYRGLQNGGNLRVVRMNHLKELTGLSRSTIYNKMDPKSPSFDADFPKQIRLGRGAVGWLLDEVHEWLEKRMRQRDGQVIWGEAEDVHR